MSFLKRLGMGHSQRKRITLRRQSETLNSVAAGIDASGNTKVFAGGSTKLFLLDSSDLSLDDVSGTTYNSTTRWKFVQFGDYMIAANGQDTLQYAELSSTISFQDLDASAPTAKLVNSCAGLCGGGQYKYRKQPSDLVGH